MNKKKQGEGSNQGATPLFIAARYGHEAVVKALLADCRLDPNGGKRSDGSTPLTVATQEGHDDVVKILIAALLSSDKTC